MVSAFGGPGECGQNLVSLCFQVQITAISWDFLSQMVVGACGRMRGVNAEKGYLVKQFIRQASRPLHNLVQVLFCNSRCFILLIQFQKLCSDVMISMQLLIKQPNRILFQTKLLLHLLAEAVARVHLLLPQTLCYLFLLLFGNFPPLHLRPCRLCLKELVGTISMLFHLYISIKLHLWGIILDMAPPGCHRPHSVRPGPLLLKLLYLTRVFSSPHCL